jgi:hypothetical protein
MPNKTSIEGVIENIEATDDEVGAWVSLLIEKAEPVEGMMDYLDNSAGMTIKAYCPPPLLGQIDIGVSYKGFVTLAGGCPPNMRYVLQRK